MISTNLRCIFLMLFFCIAFVSESFANFHDSIYITDTTGVKVKLVNPIFKRSTSDADCLGGHFCIYTSSSRDVMHCIRLALIYEISIEKITNELKVNITFHNGKKLDGYISYGEIMISGKGDLGETSYDIADVQNMIALKAWNESEYIIDGKWGVVYNDKIIPTDEFSIWNVWETNMQQLTVYLDKYFDRCSIINNNFKVHVGSATYIIKPNDIKLFIKKDDVEHINETVGVYIEKYDGGKATGYIELKSRHSYNPPSGSIIFKISEVNQSISYAVKRDDRIAYRTSYGWDGISLLAPGDIIIRSIATKRKKK